MSTFEAAASPTEKEGNADVGVDQLQIQAPIVVGRHAST